MFQRFLIRRTIAVMRLSPAVAAQTKHVLQSSQRNSVAGMNSTTAYRFYSVQADSQELTVDYDYVKNATSNKNILIVDVREPDEIKEHGKIPNSINIPLGDVSTVLSTMPDKDFEEIYQRQKPSQDTQIIFYCMIGKRSGKAQQNAINAGFKNVKNYLGSWTEWATKS